MTEANFHPTIPESELPVDGQKSVEVAGRSVLLCHHDGRIYAIENMCSHAEQPLECGRMRLGWIACPFHGARFDLETGEPLNPPATDPIAVFAIRIRDGMIEVAL